MKNYCLLFYLLVCCVLFSKGQHKTSRLIPLSINYSLKVEIQSVFFSQKRSVLAFEQYGRKSDRLNEFDVLEEDLIRISVVNLNDTSKKLKFHDPANYVVQFGATVPLTVDSIHPFIKDSSYFYFRIADLNKGDCPECVDELNLRYIKLIAYLQEQMDFFSEMGQQEILDSLNKKDEYNSFPLEVIADFYKSGFSEEDKIGFHYHSTLTFRILRL